MARSWLNDNRAEASRHSRNESKVRISGDPHQDPQNWPLNPVQAYTLERNWPNIMQHLDVW